MSLARCEDTASENSFDSVSSDSDDRLDHFDNICPAIDENSKNFDKRFLDLVYRDKAKGYEKIPVAHKGVTGYKGVYKNPKRPVVLQIVEEGRWRQLKHVVQMWDFLEEKDRDTAAALQSVVDSLQRLEGAMAEHERRAVERHEQQLTRATRERV